MKYMLNDVRGKRIELENKELCSTCGGICCKSMGCHYSPDDFSDLSFEGLKKEIDKGYISIDWWDYLEFEGKEYEYGYFLRMRNKNAPIVNPSWGGECILLTTDGCPLSFEERPKGARLLIPSENECKSLYTKEVCCIDWIKYHDILGDLHDYYLHKW